MTATFSAEVRDATVDAHRAAAGGSFLRDLTVGRRGRDDYGRLLGQWWFVYSALEHAGERFVDDEPARGFLDARLHRVAAIEADLAHVVGAEWGEGLAALPATAAYCDLIRRIDDPLRYVAHHYTRYLGDLSGGQMIGRAVSRELGFGSSDGWRFFRFDGIDDPDEYKQGYRRRLDALPLGAHERIRFVEEVRRAYAANRDVLVALDAFDVGGVGVPSAVEPAVFDAATVAAVVAHLNDDHREDVLLIVRSLAGCASASAATVVGAAPDGLHVEHDDPAGGPVVVVPWGGEVTERADIRRRLVDLVAVAGERGQRR